MGGDGRKGGHGRRDVPSSENLEGKSMRTATAMSSLSRPFSSSLSEVTESFAMNPILATRWTIMKDWMSAG